MFLVLYNYAPKLTMNEFCGIDSTMQFAKSVHYINYCYLSQWNIQIGFLKQFKYHTQKNHDLGL